MIDTHTHIYMADYADDRADVVSRAIALGVDQMLMPGVDLESTPAMLDTHRQFAQHTAFALGLHPTHIQGDWQADVDQILATPLQSGDRCVAIGEIGIDLYHDATFVDQQMQAFERQCQYAIAHHLPVIIHCRNGLDQTLEVVEGLPHGALQAVFHSFGGTPADVERIRRYGDFYFGINGIVTFKNSGLRDTLPAIPADRLLMETDAPWLSPQCQAQAPTAEGFAPKRGIRNQPAFVTHAADHVAQHLGKTYAQIEAETDANARRLFVGL